MSNNSSTRHYFFTAREVAQVAKARGLELHQQSEKIEIREKGRVLATLSTLAGACAFLHMPGVLTN